MSRALEKHIRTALEDGDHGQVFRDIAGIFKKSADAELIEVEILGKAHSPPENETFIQDGNAIGIPKLRLIQSFIPARLILQRHLAGSAVDSESEILDATAVLLLADAEHMTAANTRKRLLGNLDSPASHLLQEKWFVDSLLTSRLHRHTKSPTLWHHRRWLLGQMQRAGLSVDLGGELRDIVMVAAERHPRNYYAWSHARWLLANFPPTQGEASGKILVEVKKWCYRHHTDTSGWSYLAFVLERVTSEIDHECSLAFQETLQWATSFRWKNESVWCFLRVLVAGGSVQPDDIVAFEGIEVGQETGAVALESEPERDYVKLGQEWFRNNKLQSPR